MAEHGVHIHMCTYVRTQAWMDGWMDGWTEGWMDGWMDGGMDGWMDVCVYILHTDILSPVHDRGRNKGAPVISGMVRGML